MGSVVIPGSILHDAHQVRKGGQLHAEDLVSGAGDEFLAAVGLDAHLHGNGVEQQDVPARTAAGDQFAPGKIVFRKAAERAVEDVENEHEDGGVAAEEVFAGFPKHQHASAVHNAEELDGKDLRRGLDDEIAALTAAAPQIPQGMGALQGRAHPAAQPLQLPGAAQAFEKAADGGDDIEENGADGQNPQDGGFHGGRLLL